MDTQKKPYRFEYRTSGASTHNDGHFTLQLSQDEFEDYLFRRDRVHLKLKELGLSEEKVSWFESPLVPPNFAKKLRDFIGLAPDAVLIPYYPHRYIYRHYQTVEIEGVVYQYESFSSGSIIKFAPAYEQPLADSISSLWDGPLVHYDHGHIQTPDHAALFKTGELALPGKQPIVVKIKFLNFTFNSMQNRLDPVFETYDSKGLFKGTYFASAFKGLVL